MAKLSRILVPVEFSPRCQGAVHYAEALASHFQSEIVLLHVISPPVAYFGGLDAGSWYTNDELTDDLQRARTNLLDAFPCDPGPRCTVRRIVCVGDPACRVVETAAVEKCDLIVMPTHGHGPFRRFLLGSVTAKVLHDAICPVWTGPHMETASNHNALGVHHVLCAVDLAAPTRCVLSWAGQFAAEFGARVSMLHAIPAAETRLGPLYFDPEWRAMLARQAAEHMEYLAEDIGVRAEIVIESGEVASVVRDVARERNCDLVVIGRGTSLHAHRRLPTHAYAIARESPCPVVSV